MSLFPNFKKRVYEHKEKIIEGFTKKYNVNKLVYYEVFGDIENAILREKQIKDMNRSLKNTYSMVITPYLLN